MPGSATVTVADILELRASGLTEEETWALLCQAAQTLQDFFLSEETCIEDVVPVVRPDTVGISSKGRVVIAFGNGVRGRGQPYLAPEYAPGKRKDFSSVDWEKMWVYSLGKTLERAQGVSEERTEGLWVLRLMTAEDSRRRASLMSLLNIISEHCRRKLPVKPFSHLLMEMYREVFGAPGECVLSPEGAEGAMGDERDRWEGRRGWRRRRKKGCGGGRCSGESPERSRRRKAVERAPSRLYRGVVGGRGGGRLGGGRCVGPEFVVRGMEPAKVVEVGGGKASQRRSVTVVLLTGQKVCVRCDPQGTRCGKLLEVLVEAEELEENYIFGLACLMNGDFVFVPGEMKVQKVAPSGWKEGGREGGEELRFLLYLRVKFFLPSVRGLKSGKTKHLMYLELRRRLLEQQIRCEVEELVSLGGLALQAEFGSFDEEEHGRCSYFLLEHYLPEEVTEGRKELERRLQEEHKGRSGLDRGLAEEIFVVQVQRLPEYGSHHYTALWVRKSVSIPMWVTVNPQGVYLYEKKKSVLERKIHEAFVWKNIQGLTCNEHYFRLVPRDVFGQKIRTSYKLRMDSKKSYFLFRLASFHHQFFLKLRMELSPLEALSEEFGVKLKKEGRKRSLCVEKEEGGGEGAVEKKGEEEEEEEEELEERQNKENENPQENRREKRTGVRMGVSAFQSTGVGAGEASRRLSFSSEAYVMEASISSEKFFYDLQESISSRLARELEKVAWEEERVLRRVRLSKDKYGSFGVEIVEGGNGGLFVANVLKGVGVGGGGEGEGVRRGDQLVSVNGVCLLNLNYSEALGVVKSAGNEMEVIVSQSWKRQKPPEQEYLKHIRYETANEAENLESDVALAIDVASGQ